MSLISSFLATLIFSFNFCEHDRNVESSTQVDNLWHLFVAKKTIMSVLPPPMCVSVGFMYIPIHPIHGLVLFFLSFDPLFYWTQTLEVPSFQYTRAAFS